MRAHHFPGEYIIAGPHYPLLAWHRAGDADKPLLLLVPGGGHLARVFYGDPENEAADFLAHPLAAMGYELLALSYASDHPANPARCASMTIAQWAADLAAATASIAAPGREIILVAWSMAGRLARALPLAARTHGLIAERMISLAATPPLPNMTTPRAGGEPLTASGLWDGDARKGQWHAAILALADAEAGRAAPLTLDRYDRLYRCDNPIRLRAEPRDAEPSARLGTIIAALAPFDYVDYPLTAAVVPTSTADGRHALGDAATWGFLNAQMLIAEAERRLPDGLAGMDPRAWAELRALAASMRNSLVEEVAGNHFFFIGEGGARRTAEAIERLLAAMTPVARWRSALSVPT